MGSAQVEDDDVRDSLPSETLIDRRYVVQGMLGRGGMGYVYRVHDSARDRVLALKQLTFLPSQAAEPRAYPPRLGRRSAQEARRHAERVSLFRREFHTLAGLAHPNIISAFDYGLHDGQPYYTMELLGGSDIGRLAPLPWARACTVLRDVAEALTLLHARRLLHRDLSPSNVHLTREGITKLIDFGAMGAMGASNRVVGTPPFMAPEVLQLEELDARADLYALGALGFYLLSGRTVFPARTIAELCDYAGRRPEPPSTHVAGLPDALDALILQLLSPERSSRPDTAVEVVERLSAAIASDQAVQRSGVRVLLGAPSLVARQQQLESVRRSCMRAVHGKGTSIVLSGAAGSGRSRLLDACVLEGQLCGMRVLRCEPESREAGPLASARALLQQLRAVLGASERSALALPRSLAALVPDLVWNGAARSSQPGHASDNDKAPASDPVALQRELVGFFRRAAERRPLLIAVDDADQLDTASLQVLAGLALATPRSKLLLAVSLDESALLNPTDALRLLQLHSCRSPLAALSLDETERLLASVFGEVPNLSGVAHRVHALSAGNPRLTMELAQHLIDCGAIRHEGAAFVLPDVISEQQLPESLAGVLQARVARLSPAAQSLCFVLALSAPLPLSESEAYALVDLTIEAGAAALTELNASYMLQPRPAGLCLRQSAMAEAVSAARPAAERTALHARIAALLGADPSRRLFEAEHYFGAGNADQALAVLLSEADSENALRSWHPNYRKLMERGIEICLREGRPARDAFALRRALAQQIMTYHESGDHGPLLPVSDTLCRLSGLSDWHELSEITDPALRLRTAFMRAQARHDAAPEHERILPPPAALRQLVTYLLIMAGFASTALDLKLLELVPSLAPFAPLSPTIATLELLISGLRHLRAGRTERYLESGYEILKRLAQPGAAGFPAQEARNLELGMRYGLALTEAVLGRPAAFEHAEQLDSHESHMINAWRARQIAHLMMCDTKAADAARQKLEQLLLVQSSRQFHQGATLEGEFLAYLFADDLLGLRRILPALEQQAARHRGWRPLAQLVEASLQRVRGRPQAALGLYQRLLQELSPGRDSMWGFAAAGEVYALVEAGRMEEARAQGLQWIEACRVHELRLNRLRIELALAEAKSALGEHAAAVARVERAISEMEGFGFQGLHIGSAYEARARLALAAGDADTCRHFFGKCTEALRIGSYPGITARLQRLADRARQAGVVGLVAEVNPSLTAERARDELAGCEPANLPERALGLMLTATGAEYGHLYLLERAGLRRLASSASIDAPAGLEAFLMKHVANSEIAPEQTDQTLDVTCQTSFGDSKQALEALLLVARCGEQRLPVAVLALHFSRSRRWPTADVLEALAEQLSPLTRAPSAARSS